MTPRGHILILPVSMLRHRRSSGGSLKCGEHSNGLALVENPKRIVDSALEEFEYSLLAPGLRDRVQETIRTEIAADPLVIEQDPAKRLKPFVLAVRQEFSSTFGEIKKDYAGLAEFFSSVNEYRSFTHFVNIG